MNTNQDLPICDATSKFKQQENRSKIRGTYDLHCNNLKRVDMCSCTDSIPKNQMRKTKIRKKKKLERS